MQYCLNYSEQGFCLLKITITQFRDGFRLLILLLHPANIL